MNTATACRFVHAGVATVVDSIFVHRLGRYVEVIDGQLTCMSPVSLDRVMALYQPLNVDVLHARITFDVEFDDRLQLIADVDRVFNVAKTPDDVSRLIDACPPGELKATISNRDEALLAKSHHQRLNEATRIQMLHHLARPRPPRKEGALTTEFIRGMRGRVANSVLTPIAVELPDDMFDIAEFTTAAEYSAIHTIARDMCAAVLDLPLTENLFVYNFTEALRKYTLADDKSAIDVATLSVSPLYEQLGAGTLFAPYRPSIVRGFAHYKSRKNAKVTVIVNHVNYDVPKIVYNGTHLYASAEFLADDLRLFIDIATNNTRRPE